MEAGAKPNLQASPFSESEQAELESRSIPDGQEIQREEAAGQVSRAADNMERFIIQLDRCYTNVCWSSWRAPAFRCSPFHIVYFGYFYLDTDRDVKWLGEIFGKAFWSKTVQQNGETISKNIARLGYKGAPLAITTSLWIHVGLLAIYIGKSDTTKRTWTGFSKHPFHDVPNYLGLADPSTVKLCLELWALQILILIAGWLPNPMLETSVLSISLHIYIMVSIIPVGLSGAVSTWVSDELGAARPHAARTSVFAAVLIVAAEGILAAIAMIVMRNVLGYCYSKEHKVVKHVGQMVFLTAGAQFIDGIPTVLSGVARGCGRQKIGTCVNKGAYFAVGIPCGLLLAFYYHLGVKGLLAGIIVTRLVKLLAFIIITLRIDWENQAKTVSNQAQDPMQHKFDILLLNKPQVPQTVNPA